MLQKKDYSGKSFANPYKRFSVSSPTKRRLKKIRKRLLFLIPVVFLFGGGYSVFFTPFFVIANLELAGEYQKIHQETFLKQGRERVIGKNMVWLQTRKMKKQISGEDILSVSVKKIFPRTILLTVFERIPNFRVERGELSFLTDTTGFVMREGSDPSLVLISLPTTTPELAPSTQALTKTEFTFFNNINDELIKVNGLEIAKISKRMSNLPDFDVFSQKKWYLVVDSTKPVDALTKGLKTFLGEKYGIENNLQYIDMRIPGTIFYK